MPFFCAYRGNGMRKSAQVLRAALVAVLWACGSAHAQRSPDWAQCINEGGKVSADVAFNGCSNVIASDAGAKANLAIAYGRRGNAYYDRRDYDSAIADYTKAIEFNARDAAAYNNRGLAYRATGESDKAIADYTKAIEINPTDAIAYNHRGTAYRAKGEYDRAIADHTSAIDIDPELASAYYNRGLAYRAKGDNNKAIADFSHAIGINPMHANAYHNRGLAYRAKADNDRAIADFTEAIAINPAHANAHRNRGLAYRDKGDNARAAADLRKAIENNASPAKAHHNGDLAYGADRDSDRSVPEQRKVSEFNPEPAGDAAVLVNIAKPPPLPASSVEKAALPPSDAPRAPVTLVLKADLSTQQVTVLENGTVLHVWPISSGLRGHATPTGTFQPQWASRMWHSRQYNWTPMPYAVFFTRGVAFHGTTVTHRLGRSASHGCIRLATSNAARLFHLVHKHGYTQTQIIVFGAAKDGPPGVARRVPAGRAQTTASKETPNWARALLSQ
jgi:tetratricopeptide (TPR) repeat protein